LDQDGLYVEGSWGADLFVERVPGSVGVRKYRFDIWQPQAFGDALAALDVQRLIVVGAGLQVVQAAGIKVIQAWPPGDRRLPSWTCRGVPAMG
jgi:hypothetical protein